jgi:hypothetical protein
MLGDAPDKGMIVVGRDGAAKISYYKGGQQLVLLDVANGQYIFAASTGDVEIIVSLYGAFDTKQGTLNDTTVYSVKDGKLVFTKTTWHLNGRTIEIGDTVTVEGAAYTFKHYKGKDRLVNRVDGKVNDIAGKTEGFEQFGKEYSLKEFERRNPAITIVRTLSGEAFIEGSLGRRDANRKIVHGVRFDNEKGEKLLLLNGAMIDAGALEIDGDKLIGGAIKPLYGKALIIDRTNTLMGHVTLAASTKGEGKGEKTPANIIDISEEGGHVCIEALQTITIQGGKWVAVNGEYLNNVSTNEGEIISVLAADGETLYEIKPGQCGAVLDGHIKTYKYGTKDIVDYNVTVSRYAKHALDLPGRMTERAFEVQANANLWITNKVSGVSMAVIGGLSSYGAALWAWMSGDFSRLDATLDMATEGVRRFLGTDKRAEEITRWDALRVTIVPAEIISYIIGIRALAQVGWYALKNMGKITMAKIFKPTLTFTKEFLVKSVGFGAVAAEVGFFVTLNYNLLIGNEWHENIVRNSIALGALFGTVPFLKAIYFGGMRTVGDALIAYTVLTPVLTIADYVYNTSALGRDDSTRQIVSSIKEGSIGGALLVFGAAVSSAFTRAFGRMMAPEIVRAGGKTVPGNVRWKWEELRAVFKGKGILKPISLEGVLVRNAGRWANAKSVFLAPFKMKVNPYAVMGWGFAGGITENITWRHYAGEWHEGRTIAAVMAGFTFGPVFAFSVIADFIPAFAAALRFSPDAKGIIIAKNIMGAKAGSFGMRGVGTFAGALINPATSQPAIYMLLSRGFQIGATMVMFNAWGKGFIQPTLKPILDVASPWSWVGGAFKGFGERSYFEAFTQGFVFGMMLAPFGAAMKAAESALKNTRPFLKKVMLYADKKPLISRMKSYVDRLFTSAANKQDLKQAYDELSRFFREAYVEGGASTALQNMGLPPGLAEQIVEFIPGGGGASQAASKADVRLNLSTSVKELTEKYPELTSAMSHDTSVGNFFAAIKEDSSEFAKLLNDTYSLANITAESIKAMTFGQLSETLNTANIDNKLGFEQVSAFDTLNRALDVAIGRDINQLTFTEFALITAEGSISQLADTEGMITQGVTPTKDIYVKLDNAITNYTKNNSISTQAAVLSAVRNLVINGSEAELANDSVLKEKISHIITSIAGSRTDIEVMTNAYTMAVILDTIDSNTVDAGIFSALRTKIKGAQLKASDAKLNDTSLRSAVVNLNTLLNSDTGSNLSRERLYELIELSAVVADKISSVSSADTIDAVLELLITMKSAAKSKALSRKQRKELTATLSKAASGIFSRLSGSQMRISGVNTNKVVDAFKGEYTHAILLNIIESKTGIREALSVLSGKFNIAFAIDDKTKLKEMAHSLTAGEFLKYANRADALTDNEIKSIEKIISRSSENITTRELLSILDSELSHKIADITMDELLPNMTPREKTAFAKNHNVEYECDALITGIPLSMFMLQTGAKSLNEGLAKLGADLESDKTKAYIDELKSEFAEDKDDIDQTALRDAKLGDVIERLELKGSKDAPKPKTFAEKIESLKKDGFDVSQAKVVAKWTDSLKDLSPGIGISVEKLIEVAGIDKTKDEIRLNRLDNTAITALQNYFGMEFKESRHIKRENGAIVKYVVNKEGEEVIDKSFESGRAVKKLEAQKKTLEHKMENIRLLEDKLNKLQEEKKTLKQGFKQNREEIAEVSREIERLKKQEDIEGINRKIELQKEAVKKDTMKTLKALKAELYKERINPLAEYIFVDNNEEKIDMRYAFINLEKSGNLSIRKRRADGTISVNQISFDGYLVDGNIAFDAIGIELDVRYEYEESAKDARVELKDIKAKLLQTKTSDEKIAFEKRKTELEDKLNKMPTRERTLTAKDSDTKEVLCVIKTYQKFDGDYSFNIEDPSGNIIDSSRGEKIIKDKTENKKLRASLAIADALTKTLTKLDTTKEEGGKHPHYSENIDQVQAILDVAFIPNTFFGMPTGFGKTKVVFNAVSLINSSLKEIYPDGKFEGKKTMFVLHDMNQFMDIAKKDNNEKFRKWGLDVVSITQDEIGDANLQKPITLVQLMDAPEGARDTFIEKLEKADVIYINADTLKFLQLKIRNQKGELKDRASRVWNTIFKNTKLIHDEVDTAFFTNRAQEGLEPRPLKGIENESAHYVDEFMNILINAKYDKKWNDSQIDAFLKGKSDDRVKSLLALEKKSYDELYKELSIAPKKETYKKSDKRYDEMQRELIKYKFSDGEMDYGKWMDKGQKMDYTSAFWDDKTQARFLSHVNRKLSKRLGKDMEMDEFKKEQDKEIENLRASFIGRANVLRQYLEADVEYHEDMNKLGLIRPAPNGVLAPELQLSDPYFASHTEFVFKRVKFSDQSDNVAQNHKPLLENIGLSSLATVTSMASVVQDAIGSGADFSGFSATVRPVKTLSKLMYGINVKDLRENSDDYIKNLAHDRITSLSYRSTYNDAEKSIIEGIKEARLTAALYLDGRSQESIMSADIIKNIAEETGKIVLAKERGMGWTLNYCRGNKLISVKIELEQEFDKIKDKHGKAISFGVANYLDYVARARNGDTDAMEQMIEALESLEPAQENGKSLKNIARECVEKSIFVTAEDKEKDTGGVVFYINAPATRATDIKLPELKKDIETIVTQSNGKRRSSIESFGVVDSATTSWFLEQLIGRDRGIRSYDKDFNEDFDLNDRDYHDTHIYVIERNKAKQSAEPIRIKAEIEGALSKMFADSDKRALENALYSCSSDMITIQGAEYLSGLQFNEDIDNQEFLHEAIMMYQSQIGLNSDIDSAEGEKPKTGREALQDDVDRFMEFMLKIQRDERYKSLSPSSQASIDSEIELYFNNKMVLNLKSSDKELADPQDRPAHLTRAARMSELISFIKESISEEKLPDVAPLAGASTLATAAKRETVKEHIESTNRSIETGDEILEREGMAKHDPKTDEMEYTREGGLAAEYGADIYKSGLSTLISMVLSGWLKEFGEGEDDDPLEMAIVLMRNGVLSSDKNNFHEFKSRLEQISNLLRDGVIEPDALNKAGFVKILRFRTPKDIYAKAILENAGDTSWWRGQLSMIPFVNVDTFKGRKALRKTVSNERIKYNYQLRKFREHYAVEPWLALPSRIPFMPKDVGRGWMPLILAMSVGNHFGSTAGILFYPAYYAISGGVLPDLSIGLGKLMHKAAVATSRARLGIAIWSLQREIDSIGEEDAALAKFITGAINPNANSKVISEAIDDGNILRKALKNAGFSKREIRKYVPYGGDPDTILNVMLPVSGKHFESPDELMNSLNNGEIFIGKKEGKLIKQALRQGRVGDKLEVLKKRIEIYEREGIWGKVKIFFAETFRGPYRGLTIKEAIEKETAITAGLVLVGTGAVGIYLGLPLLAAWKLLADTAAVYMVGKLSRPLSLGVSVKRAAKSVRKLAIRNRIMLSKENDPRTVKMIEKLDTGIAKSTELISDHKSDKKEIARATKILENLNKQSTYYEDVKDAKKILDEQVGSVGAIIEARKKVDAFDELRDRIALGESRGEDTAGLRKSLEVMGNYRVLEAVLKAAKEEARESEMIEPAFNEFKEVRGVFINAWADSYEKTPLWLIELDDIMNEEIAPRRQTSEIYEKMKDITERYKLNKEEVELMYEYSQVISPEYMGLDYGYDAEKDKFICKTDAEKGSKAQRMADIMQQALNIPDEQIAELEKQGNSGLVEKLKRIKEIQKKSSLEGGSVVVFKQGLETGANAERMDHAVAFDRAFLEFVLRVSETHKKAAAFILFERLGHELCHTGAVKGIVYDAVEEIRNKFYFDYTMAQVLHNNPELREEIDDLFKKYGDLKDVKRFRFSSAHFYQTLLTRVDDGKRALISEDEAFAVLWKEVIERISTQLRHKGTPVSVSFEALKDKETASEIIEPFIKKECENDPFIILEKLTDLLEGFVSLNNKLSAIGQELADGVEPKDLADTYNSLNTDPTAFAKLVAKQAEGKEAFKDIYEVASSIVDSGITELTFDNVEKIILETMQKTSRDLLDAKEFVKETDLILSILMPFGGLRNRSIIIMGLAVTNLEKGNYDMAIALYEEVKPVFENEARLLTEKISSAPDEDIAIEEFVSQSKDEGINDEITDRIIDSFYRVKEIDDAVKEAQAEKAKGVVSKASSSGLLDEMRINAQKILALQGVSGAMFDPLRIFSIQALKPKMPQLETETAVTVFTKDTAQASVNIVNAATTRGYELPVTSGQSLILESYTITDALAQTLGAIMAKIPKDDNRDSITVSVYGDNSSQAIDMLARYNVTATKELKKANVATVVYTKTRIDAPAEYTRFIEVEQPIDMANNIVTASQVVLAIFHMPFKQFITFMNEKGIDIGLSEDDMQRLFVNADTAAGTIRIKPVDNDEINRINRLVAQNA